jgi:hypothetical protein
MRRGARTPEDLETLLEDAFVLRSGEMMAELFEDGACSSRTMEPGKLVAKKK